MCAKAASTPATGTNDTDPADRHELEEFQKDWWWFLLLGVAMVILGTIAICAPLVVTLVSAAVFGVVLLIGGVIQLVSSFWTGHWSGFFVHILIGILYLVVGMLIVKNPVAGAAGITLLLAALFIVGGVFRIVASLQLRFHNWGWALASGIVSLLLGILIVSEIQVAALLIIGLYIGIELLFNGWTWIMLSLNVRNIGCEEE